MKWLVTLLIITNMILAWRWYDLSQELNQRDFLQENRENYVLELEKKVLTLEKALAESEAKTLAEELNEALFEGWGELLDVFKSHLQETQKKIEKHRQRQPNDQLQNDQLQNDQLQNDQT
jgi:hypothetical protein